ncbi:hypothetical protein NA57DRAFT_44223, partial [Rhizodiscina lignyota]
QWQAAYDELAKYVWASEPTTETYYFGIPMDYAHDFSATTSMLAFEVYGSRDDLYKTHLNSPSMGAFLKKIPAASATGLDLNHYSLVAGYLDKPGDKTECGIMLDVKLTAGSAAARKSLNPKLKKLASDVDKADPDGGVYTFMTFESIDNDVDGRIYARFRDRDAMEKFLRRKEWTDFWMSTKDEVAKMESRAYLHNGKGWLYRNKAARL